MERQRDVGANLVGKAAERRGCGCCGVTPARAGELGGGAGGLSEESGGRGEQPSHGGGGRGSVGRARAAELPLSAGPSLGYSFFL